MKKKKLFVMLAAAVMASVMLTGCKTSETKTETEGTTATADTTAVGESEAEGVAAKDLKVAAVFGGPITDKSWNETAYNGLLAIEEMGAEISYVENCAASEAPDAIRTFASSGYNVVYVNSSAFKDSAYEIAGEFPDVTFIINGAGEQGENFVSLSTANYQQGYLQGVLCALASKDGKVGMINGTEMTPTLDGEAGFYQGVAYVNEKFGKNVETKVTYLGNYTDTTAGYETANSFIAEGYTTITTMADNASNSVLQACEENGVLCVGNGSGQNEVAPTTLIASVKKNNEGTYVQSFKEYLDGTLFEKASEEVYGVNYGVVGIDELYDAASVLTEEEKAFLDETLTKLSIGEIEVLTMVDYKAAQ
ncbi:MAG: basic rane lipoprotein [Lachnospiraceae bacterium]|jgi:basic membrane lipoprotein Med (substrate-binding protein (PBP1-ABC) superfamily)|nr:basic rane lipoprotein [Lachnospiraceae bacterium]